MLHPPFAALSQSDAVRATFVVLCADPSSAAPFRRRSLEFVANWSAPHRRKIECSISIDCVVRQNCQSGIDIDMIQVIRRDRSQFDCLSVSFGYTIDQFILGVPLGSTKTSYVPPRSHVARVRERASSWIPLFKTLIGSRGRGKSKGKLANDQK
ncbi:hypothetical protein E5676_scaffold1163G00580 [Cucumis melo var. makuwa]|uniref:Uncharacterized protein n=1 Tax=Cucumis melo var. makuwa TaxID=1194695 RepID=A0A5A7UG65_CUCMM|nr:hypothetical protein E6C27_scaffold43052G00820 [Cucumis melo var. makuwa]TYK22732.1 hypothetical protein E5676_scaffold1163G00580 [Cucumis melo var. makuwa]